MLDPALQRTLWVFFLIHAVIFVCANFFLIILNLLTYWRTPWFIYPLFFWFLFLLLHFYFNKLLISGFFQKLWNDFLDRLDK